ncbi:MAG: hypothetical protein O3C40_27060 [Planctomycetota bacterium]|nr:hypothetical protein [Planctomycetota bacterium]
MPIKLVGCNVAIVAAQFNPSIFSQLWLVRHGIVDEDDLLEGCIHTDQLARVSSKKFHLLVIPPQLQLVPTVPEEDEAVVVATKVGAIVHLLPHTPYVAIGMNFNWQVFPDSGTVLDLAKSLFYVPTSPVSAAVGDDNLGLGAYYSRDIFGGRMRLDIKPRSEGHVHADRLQFDFNFQFDLNQDNTGGNIRSIDHHLANWSKAKQESLRIAQAAVSTGVSI